MALLVFVMVGSAGYVARGLFGEKEVRLTLLGLLHPLADRAQDRVQERLRAGEGR